MPRRSIGAPRQSRRPLSLPATRRSPTPEKISKTSAGSVDCRSRRLCRQLLRRQLREKRQGNLPWVAAIILVAVIAGALLMRRNSPSPEAPTPVATVAPEAAKPTEPPAPPVATPPREEPAARESAPPRGEPPASPGARQAAAPISLGTVQLCKTFSTRDERWTCDPADDPAARGRIVLYTRVKSPRDTTVVHRWYRGDELQQSVTLVTRASVDGRLSHL